jgi:hypothetical protein
VRKLALVAVAAFGLGLATAQIGSRLSAVEAANPGEMTRVADDIASDFEFARSRATGAPQATQAAVEASVAYQYALVKQNDEIIRLLRQIATK